MQTNVNAPSLVCLLLTARCARALHCALSFARSLTHSLPSSWESAFLMSHNQGVLSHSAPLLQKACYKPDGSMMVSSLLPGFDFSSFWFRSFNGLASIFVVASICGVSSIFCVASIFGVVADNLGEAEIFSSSASPSADSSRTRLLRDGAASSSSFRTPSFLKPSFGVGERRHKIKYYATEKKRNTFRQWFMIFSFSNK